MKELWNAPAENSIKNEIALHLTKGLSADVGFSLKFLNIHDFEIIFVKLKTIQY